MSKKYRVLVGSGVHYTSAVYSLENVVEGQLRLTPDLEFVGGVSVAVEARTSPSCWTCSQSVLMEVEDE